MRLIDADAFLADESEAYMKAQIALAEQNADRTIDTNRYINLLVHKKIQMLIADAPTIEPKQGEWIEQEDCWQCSECGEEFVLEVDVKPIDAEMNFCPNCGARMTDSEKPNNCKDEPQTERGSE